jgi:hypothetical protein
MAYHLPSFSLCCLFCLFTEDSELSLAPCPTPFLLCRFSIPPASFTVCAWLQFTVCFPVLLGWRLVCPGVVLVYIQRGGLGIPVWCVVLTCLFCQLMQRQVWSQWWQQREMASNFLNAVWDGEAFHRSSVAPMSQGGF